MLKNSEVRFRLNSTNDGSAYIRTETAIDAGGWQKSHFHKSLRETYIVEKGWVGFAQSIDGKVHFSRFERGQMFTTAQGLVHNVYMPSDSVIHTVKHGAPTATGKKSDWWGESEECLQLTREIGDSFPTQIRSVAEAEPFAKVDPEKQYNAAYRHFDTLIWQVSAWSSALFAAIASGVNSLFKAAAGNGDVSLVLISVEAGTVTLSGAALASVELAFFGTFTGVLAYALHRFRWHQLGTKPWRRSRKSPQVSPQFLLQATVSFESAILLLASAFLAGIHIGVASAILGLLLLFLLFGSEQSLTKRMRRLGKLEQEPRTNSPAKAVRGAS